MTVRGITPQALADLFRASMRIAPASVSLVTARGADGGRAPPRSIGGKGQGVCRFCGATLSSQICTAEAAHDYGTHTIFVGRSTSVPTKSPHRTYRR